MGRGSQPLSNGHVTSALTNGTSGFHQISGLQGCQGPLVVSLPPPVSQRATNAKERPPRSIPVVKVAQPVRQSWTQARGSKKDHHNHHQLTNGTANNNSSNGHDNKRSQTAAVAVPAQPSMAGVVQRVNPLHVHVGNPQPGEETQSEIFWDF